LTATHDAPKEANATAQGVFWKPLDGLVEASRGPGPVRGVLLWLFARVLLALGV
jgi:hypothetical protein